MPEKPRRSSSCASSSVARRRPGTAARATAGSGALDMSAEPTVTFFKLSSCEAAAPQVDNLKDVPASPLDLGGVGRRGVVLDVALHATGYLGRVELAHEPERHVDARRDAGGR